MPLEPGTAYFLSAEVVFEPVLKRDYVGNVLMYDWNFRILSSGVSQTKLDYFSRQQAEVRRR